MDHIVTWHESHPLSVFCYQVPITCTDLCVMVNGLFGPVDVISDWHASSWMVKHQAGTAPISTSPGLMSKLWPTIHYLLSNYCTTIALSLSKSMSSSGSTSTNSWQTLQPLTPRIIDDKVPNMDTLDVGQLPTKLKSEPYHGKVSPPCSSRRW